MDSLADKNITVIVSERSTASDLLVSAVRDTLQLSEPTIQVRGLPLSELNPTYEGHVIVTLDSIKHNNVIHTDIGDIITIIRDQVSSIIPIVIYMMGSGDSKQDFEMFERWKRVAILHHSPAFLYALRMVLNSPPQ